MKRTLAAIALAATTQLAHAGYADVKHHMDWCDSVGQIARHQFMFFKDDEQKMLDRYRNNPVISADPTRLEVTEYAIKYGSEKATSAKDAYMEAYAHCMDSE